MPYPVNLITSQPNLFGGKEFNVSFYSGLTILVGPNGSGKTQFLKFLKPNGHISSSDKIARYLSAGRLGFHEHFRANPDGGPQYFNQNNVFISSSSSKQYRHNSESAVGDFFTLSIRADIQIKVSERLRKLFKRDIIIEWENGNLKVNFKSTLNNSIPYASAQEASGLLHLVSILSALYDDEIGLLLIDEPEVSLHPQLQAFLRMEIENVAGDATEAGKKMIIISTHSTEFINIRKPEEICNIIFFNDSDSIPIQLNPDDDILKYSQLRNLLLRLNQSYKSAFFSKRPLLVEGPSDETICSFLEAKFDLYLNASGSYILPVNGNSSMPVACQLFQAIGKKPIILTDLDTLASGLSVINSISFDDLSENIAQENGHTSVKKMASVIYNDFCDIFNKYHKAIFNQEEISNLNNEKLKYFFMKYILNNNNETLASTSEELVIMKNRISGLLGVLENGGLFLLKKGNIEDYYMSSHIMSSHIKKNKIDFANDECEYLQKIEHSPIMNHYDDVFRAIQFASQTPVINEANALSEILLSFASPAISKLQFENPELEIANMAVRILLEKVNLFSFYVNNGEVKELVVDLNSSILNVKGFPIIFKSNSNPNEIVSNNIKPK